ncbi:MAG: tRNA (guanosine(37)-N1)-methyltransferase TrmD [Ruminococcaceae bacterium]|nr:tRNA (guanosine(37)-N1)-methyltransferase TrmD [Oscillospiraceae bacterium]MBQ3956461.1 tRNA (guanosine(37)-N1)-methyltransferase TrmD [Clostridia bacterium]
MRIDILTLFPEYVDYILSESIIGRARRAGKLDVRAHNIRDWSEDKHRRVDDTPYGGGRGMLMAAPPIWRAWKAVCETDFEDPGSVRRKTVYLSPRGTVFRQEKAKELSGYDQLILICGHYEGVDERLIEEIVDEEISVGDFVLTGGELPACLVADAVGRLCDGVLSLPECYENESFEDNLLEYPQYTRPPVWMGREVPEVLLSGHHANIEKWRREQSERITRERRPDLLEEKKETP